MDDAIQRKSRLKPTDWQVLATLAALAVAVAVVVAVYIVKQGGAAETARVVTGVQFPYPEGWSEQALTDEDRGAGLMLKLESDDPEGSFLARTVIARVPADLDLNELAAETESALAAEVEGFEPVSTEVVPLGDYQAVEVTYRQSGEAPAGEYTVRMTIVPAGDQTFYLTLRSPSAVFSSVRNDGRRIAEDFATYVSAARQ